MKDKEIKNILFKLLSSNCSTEKALALLGGTEGIKSMIASENLKILTGTHLSDYVNVKCPLKSFGEIIENHEDAITDLNIEELGENCEIETLHDALKVNAKQANYDMESVRYKHQGLKPGSHFSPYRKWKGDSKVHLIFGDLDEKNSKRNILSMDPGIGLTHAEAEDVFMLKIGNSIKKNRKYSRGVLGVGESACLKHCFLRVSATRKRGDHDMTLLLSIYIKDPSLVKHLDHYNSNCFPVLQLVTQSGNFFKVTSEDLTERFGGDYLKFENDNSFELSNIPSAPKTFDYGFVNRLVGYHMPNIKGISQIAKHPETNFSTFLNERNELTACPVIIHEANPTTRPTYSATGASIALKGFNFQFDSWCNNLNKTSASLTAKFDNNGIGKSQSFLAPVEVLFKGNEKCNLRSGIHMIIRGKICHYDTDLLSKQVLRKKVKRSLTKAEKDALKKMIVRIDLNQIPSNLNSYLLTGDKGQISPDSPILVDLLDQLQIVFDSDEFESALKEEEWALKKNSHKSANFKNVQDHVFRSLNVFQKNVARISSSNTVTSSKKTPLITLHEEPTFLSIFKDKYKVDKATKHSTIIFKTDGEKDFFLNGEGVCSEDISIIVTYGNKNIFTGLTYNHGVLRAQYDASFITESLSEGEEVEVNWNISKKLGFSSSGSFKLEVIRKNANSAPNNQPNTQLDPKELREGNGNQPTTEGTDAVFKYLDKDSYKDEVMGQLDDDEFKKALKEQFPALNNALYLKRNSHYFIMKLSPNSYKVLINQDTLSDHISNGELCNDRISEILVKNSIRICSHENILLSDNYDISFHLANQKSPKLLTR